MNSVAVSRPSPNPLKHSSNKYVDAASMAKARERFSTSTGPWSALAFHRAISAFTASTTFIILGLPFAMAC